MVVDQVGEAPFSQSQLLSGDCFLIDAAAANKVFVWKGKDAASEERKGAIESADKFIKKEVTYLPYPYSFALKLFEFIQCKMSSGLS